MVIDTSALVAILSLEPEAARLAQAIEADPTRLISAATLLEAGIVMEARLGAAETVVDELVAILRDLVERPLVDAAGVDVVVVVLTPLLRRVALV